MAIGKKTGGRKPGTPNKIDRSLPIEELCAFHNCSPVEILISLCSAKEDGLKFQAAKELMNYLYPKKRALEIDGNINIELAKKAEEYASLPQDEQIKLMEEELTRLKG